MKIKKETKNKKAKEEKRKPNSEKKKKEVGGNCNTAVKGKNYKGTEPVSFAEMFAAVDASMVGSVSPPSYKPRTPR